MAHIRGAMVFQECLKGKKTGNWKSFEHMSVIGSKKPILCGYIKWSQHNLHF